METTILLYYCLNANPKQVGLSDVTGELLKRLRPGLLGSVPFSIIGVTMALGIEIGIISLGTYLHNPFKYIPRNIMPT